LVLIFFGMKVSGNVLTNLFKDGNNTIVTIKNRIIDNKLG